MLAHAYVSNFLNTNFVYTYFYTKQVLLSHENGKYSWKRENFHKLANVARLDVGVQQLSQLKLVDISSRLTLS